MAVNKARKEELCFVRNSHTVRVRYICGHNFGKPPEGFIEMNEEVCMAHFRIGHVGWSQKRYNWSDLAKFIIDTQRKIA